MGENFLSLFPERIEFIERDGFYFIPQKKFSVFLRREREIFSEKKYLIAKRVVGIMSFLPTVKLVAITGSLAMENSDFDSDIDIMVVVRSGFLWTTRFLVYLIFFVFRIPFRRFGSKDTRDRVCLNIWLDEKKLGWPKRNIFTAHEILQIVPLLNRDWTYERFLFVNFWAFEYWPNAVDKKILRKISKLVLRKNSLFSFICFIWLPFELLFFALQRLYMIGKVKNEVVLLDRAIFHPVDISDKVLNLLSSCVPVKKRL